MNVKVLSKNFFELESEEYKQFGSHAYDRRILNEHIDYLKNEIDYFNKNKLKFTIKKKYLSFISETMLMLIIERDKQVKKK